MYYYRCQATRLLLESDDAASQNLLTTLPSPLAFPEELCLVYDEWYLLKKKGKEKLAFFLSLYLMCSFHYSFIDQSYRNAHITFLFLICYSYIKDLIYREWKKEKLHHLEFECSHELVTRSRASTGYSFLSFPLPLSTSYCSWINKV